MASTDTTRSNLSNDVLLAFFLVPPAEEWITGMRTKYPGLEVRWALLKEGGKTTTGTTTRWALGGLFALISLAHQGLIDELEMNPNVVFANARGVTGSLTKPQIAEWAMGTWLAHGHQLYQYHDNKKKGEWERWSMAQRVQDPPGHGVLGYGAIGRQVGRIAKALGMEVYAYTRSECPTAESRRDHDYVVPGTGDPEGTMPTRWFHGASRKSIREFLSQDLDLLVIRLPLNDTTGNLISYEEFEILSKKKTFVSNIARGRLINTEALIDALKKGQIRGAAVDVTDPEPLPRGHPLWEAPDLFISPHVSWQSDKFFDRVLEILEINLERLSQGKQPIHLVQRKLNVDKDGN